MAANHKSENEIALHDLSFDFYIFIIIDLGDTNVMLSMNAHEL
jgi:hypothetical protein